MRTRGDGGRRGRGPRCRRQARRQAGETARPQEVGRHPFRTSFEASRSHHHVRIIGTNRTASHRGAADEDDDDEARHSSCPRMCRRRTRPVLQLRWNPRTQRRAAVGVHRGPAELRYLGAPTLDGHGGGCCGSTNNVGCVAGHTLRVIRQTCEDRGGGATC